MTLPILNRVCGDCHVCCGPSLSIDGGTFADHLHGDACPQLRAGKCTRYDDRPQVCRSFVCEWMLGMGGEPDRPDRSDVLVYRSWSEAAARAHAAVGINPRFTENGRGMVWMVVTTKPGVDTSATVARLAATGCPVVIRVLEREDGAPTLAPKGWAEVFSVAPTETLT
jgi:hypothetical protein